MSAFDITSLAQWKVNPGDTVISCVNASLMQGWVRTTRYLAIVSNGRSSALFVLTSSNIPPSSVQEINIERIVPFDLNFKCDLDSEAKDVGPDLYLGITYQKLILLFELDLGDKSNMFVAELYKATEKVNRGNGFLEFGWLQKYNPVYKLEESEEETEQESDLMDSPDISINRESIATGGSLIAAREAVVKYQMSKKEQEYTYKHSFRVFIGTWNVNGQPPTVSLQEWLACDVEPPDIYAIGFQELDLSKEAYVFADSPREEEWRIKVEKGLHQGAKYHQVALVRLIGMLLIVYVKMEHRQHVRKVAVDTVGTGVMGKMGNKGGVSVRMEIHNTSICFVNSHLAAHVEEFERRNQDYKSICRRTRFSGFTPPLTIRDHDQVFWLGDLNYRITGLDVNVVKQYLERRAFKPILEQDQLNIQRRLENVFKDFKEGLINFMPTYKYDVGTDNWDSSEKGRPPAWCDRILWRGESIEQLEYRSHQVYRISDHKPVSSIFKSEVKLIDMKKYRKIHEELMKKLDKLENEFLPQITVDVTEIKFQPVKFLEPQSSTLTVANNGQVPVTFEFIKKLDDANYCKDWLTIEPYTGNVNPGETCEISLDVLVDKKSAFKLNSGQDKLYDILVLHLVGGKDIFITVTGEYERSCFGTSLETLAHIPGPIKEFPLGNLVALEKQLREGTQGADTVGSYPIPKEVWFLVDHLHRHGMRTPQLFIQAGLQSEIAKIRNWLDYWSLDPMPGSVYSVAESLVLLLESTAEPIIPYEQYSKCLEVASNYQACKKIIQELPFHKKNVFIYLCMFLRELLAHSDDNGLDISTLAGLFGGIFLRDPPWLTKGAPAGKYWVITQTNSSIRKKVTFVSNFLSTDDPHLYQSIVATTGL